MEQNLARARGAIADAARGAGRDPASVTLVAVTKSVNLRTALDLCRLGQLDLGENRVEALEQRARAFREHDLACRWHFVGHVQRNKARRVAEVADVVHSVDSEALIETLDRGAGNVGRSLGVYLQVKLHPEATKSGLAPEDLQSAVRAVTAAPALHWLGLMTMAPLVTDDAERAGHLAEQVFTELARLSAGCVARGAPGSGLSMGMSGDFERAIRHGATCVRIGTRLFEGVAANEGAA
ncbi:MAG: YggS family pyridoxal phosphate-dependent enzyme [Planctomycetes bacterium]|nr:YggS family pyridoxal phosphate-dependent enzyme [Planctomycetota bacterium]